MGMCFKHRRWTEEDLERIKEMYYQNTSIRRVARHFRVSPNTIKNRLKEMGIKN